MDDFFRESLYAGVVLSLVTYGLGLVLKRRLKLGVFYPLLVSIALTIAVLASCGVSYEAYASGARYLSWLLTPATVCLAIPLYEKREALVRNARAILLALTAGAVTSCLTVLVLAALLRLDHRLYVTLLPKSITTAIGMGIAEELEDTSRLRSRSSSSPASSATSSASRSAASSASRIPSRRDSPSAPRPMRSARRRRWSSARSRAR